MPPPSTAYHEHFAGEEGQELAEHPGGVWPCRTGPQHVSQQREIADRGAGLAEHMRPHVVERRGVLLVELMEVAQESMSGE